MTMWIGRAKPLHPDSGYPTAGGIVWRTLDPAPEGAPKGFAERVSELNGICEAVNAESEAVAKDWAALQTMIMQDPVAAMARRAKLEARTWEIAAATAELPTRLQALADELRTCGNREAAGMAFTYSPSKGERWHADRARGYLAALVKPPYPPA